MAIKIKRTKTIDELIVLFEKRTKIFFDSESSGHDIYHLKRVLNLGLNIQKQEGGDKVVVASACFLHDLHRIMGEEKNKYYSPKNSLSTVKKILEGSDLRQNKIVKILDCIEFHEEYSFSDRGKSTYNLETQIVQDADNLDAIGAIGIARAFSFGGAKGIPIWRPEIPFKERNFEESSWDYSEIHHFYTKLLKLKNNMNTKTAKKMAEERHKFMKNYLKQFFIEWEGRK